MRQSLPQLLHFQHSHKEASPQSLSLAGAAVGAEIKYPCENILFWGKHLKHHDKYHVFPSWLTAKFLEVTRNGDIRLKPHRLPHLSADQNTSLWKKASICAERCLPTPQTDISQNIQVLEVQSRNNVWKIWRRFKGEKEWWYKGQGDKGTHLINSHKRIHLMISYIVTWEEGQVFQ